MTKPLTDEQKMQAAAILRMMADHLERSALLKAKIYMTRPASPDNPNMPGPDEKIIIRLKYDMSVPETGITISFDPDDPLAKALKPGGAQ